MASFLSLQREETQAAPKPHCPLFMAGYCFRCVRLRLRLRVYLSETGVSLSGHHDERLD
jgi:hypothetical protein